MKQKNFNIDDLPKENPFLVPDGYFDRLPDVVMKRVRKTEQPRPKVVHWHRYAVAAAVTGIIAVAGLVSLDIVHEREVHVAEAYEEDFYESELDYAMINNSEIEMYLAEADY